MRRLLLLAVALTLIAPLALSAQRGRGATAAPGKPAKPAPARRAERPVPFAVGETLTYDVSWSSFLTAGTATATVKEKKPSFNSTAYYILVEGRPTPLVGRLYSLYYKLDTLLDSYTLLSQRGSLYSEEGARHRLKVSRFDRPASKVFFEYESSGTVSDTFKVPPLTQDGLSALYVLRTLPLKSGARLTVPITDSGISYTLHVDVGPSERLKVPYGEAAALKLKLTIADADGASPARDVALWLSDDGRRLPMKLQAVVALGSFDLNLRAVQ